MEIRFELLPLPNYYTAPAHPHATDAAMYTALFESCRCCYFKLNVWILVTGWLLLLVGHCCCWLEIVVGWRMLVGRCWLEVVHWVLLLLLGYLFCVVWMLLLGSGLDVVVG